MFNHFQFNTEITTKSGLCKNLYQNTSPEMKVDQWFPRCYDLSQSGQTEELVEDCYRTIAQTIIKKHFQMFKFYSKEQLTSEYQRLENLKSVKETVGAYNYKENKSNIQWEQFQ